MKQNKKAKYASSEDKEREYWAVHDSSEVLDWRKAKRTSFPNLKPTYTTISIRLPKILIEELKMLANKRDVPYQSLLKIFLTDRVAQELSRK